MEVSSSKTLVPIYQYTLCYSYPMIYVKIMCQYSLLQKKSSTTHSLTAGKIENAHSIALKKKKLYVITVASVVYG